MNEENPGILILEERIPRAELKRLVDRYFGDNRRMEFANADVRSVVQAVTFALIGEGEEL